MSYSLLYKTLPIYSQFQLIHYVKVLFYKLERLPRVGVTRFRTQLLTEARRYFRGEDSRLHFADVESREECALATLLDPRFKKIAFADQGKATSAADLLLAKVNDLAMNDSVRSIHAIRADASTDDDFAACLAADDGDDEITFLDTATSTNELTAYLKEKNLGPNVSPFSYWEANEHKYPTLATLARRYLCSPMSSVASERLFKVGKQVTKERPNLKPENAEKLLFLKYNLRMTSFKY